MNNIFIFCVGLSMMVPAQLHSLDKQKIKAPAKIGISCASALATSVVLHNIASTAQRRIANPEYKGSKSFAAILGQMCSILLHNKGLATIVLGLTGLSAYCMSSAIAELRDASDRDSQEL
jgi:hypothetical protein